MVMRKSVALLIIVAFTVALAGCATESGYYDPARSAGAGALGGAATGAALGSIIGVATGNPATGAWVGAATGAIAGGLGGYLYAQHKNSQVRSAQAAAQTYNYTPAQGNMVQIDQASVSPSSARPGQAVNLYMAYTILTPGNTATSATLYREVRLGNQVVGQPFQTQVTNYNGSYSDQVAYNIPSNAPRGSYTVISRLNSSAGSAERVSYFSVM